MGEIQWIKLYTDFFEDRKIKQIRAMPDGNAILLIWINLLLIAGDVNDGGLIYVTPGVPYTDQSLAEELRQPLMTVQTALRAFAFYHMIEETGDGLLVSNWEKRQNIDKMERVREQNRLRKQKERSQKRLNSRDCHATVTQCHATEEEIEEEKEEEREIYNLYAPPQYDTDKVGYIRNRRAGENESVFEGVNGGERHLDGFGGACEAESRGTADGAGADGAGLRASETGPPDWRELSKGRLH